MKAEGVKAGGSWRGGSFLVYLPPGRGAGSGINMGEVGVFTYAVFVGVVLDQVIKNLVRVVILDSDIGGTALGVL